MRCLDAFYVFGCAEQKQVIYPSLRTSDWRTAVDAVQSPAGAPIDARVGVVR